MSNIEIDVNALSEVVNDKADRDLGNLTEEGNVKLGKGGLELCDIGMALYVDETKGLRRYLNGQIVDINTNTQAFLNRLLEIKNTNQDYFTTEENWQAEATLNIDGCVYKFVLNYSGDNVVSVRLPKYPDYVEINAGGTLPVVGNGINIGVTSDNSNIVGLAWDNTIGVTSGKSVSLPNNAGSSGVSITSGYGLGLTTDPTKSGIQTTLKQTKLKMRYFIQIATGSETENNIINDIELNNPYSLFDSKYSDHELNNLSWLKSEGQWNAKAVYPTAYDKLLKVYNGTETVEGLSVVKQNESYKWQTVLPDSNYSVWTKRRNVKVGDIVFGYNPRVIVGYIQSVNGDNITCTNSMDSAQTSFNFGGISDYDVVDDYDFVLNTTDETFRLPLKTKQKFYEDIAPVVGNDISLGFTKGTSDGFNLQCNSNGNATLTVKQYGNPVGSPYSDVAGINSSIGITTDPTKSGIETHLTEATLYLYFYVGETVQNANLIDAGRIGEQLATKTDMQQAAKASMPSNRYIDLTPGATGTTYIAPADGWISFAKKITATGQFVNLSNNTIGMSIMGCNAKDGSGGNTSCFISCKKGDEVATWYSAGGDVIILRFIYAEGAQ